MSMSLYGTQNYGVALQPCGEGDPTKHYEDTVRGGFDVNAHAGDFLPENLRRLRDLESGHGRVALWGLTRSAHKDENASSNISKWSQLRDGTAVAFVHRDTIISTGRVVGSFRDEEAARQIWSLKGDLPFEFMYVLADMTPRDIPFLPFKRLAGAKLNGVVQSLVYPDAAAAETVLETLGQELTAGAEGSSEGQGDGPGLPGGWDSTDEEVIAKRRREQRALRDLLIERDGELCILCGATVPAEFLWAAHIKKRAVCSDAERHDLHHVAFLACRFGCDDLFERGYIGVDVRGNLVLSQLMPEALSTLGHLELLKTRTAGTPLRALVSGPSSVYLEWHRTNTFRTPA